MVVVVVAPQSGRTVEKRAPAKDLPPCAKAKLVLALRVRSRDDRDRSPKWRWRWRSDRGGAGSRRNAVVSVSVHPARLRRELARRGLSASDMAREAGLSGATVSAALMGRSISMQSLSLMVKVLLRVPTIEIIDTLILGEPDDHGLE